MKHTAFIVTAEGASGAHFAARFLLPALRFAASLCCGDVREIRREEVDGALEAKGEDEAVLVLDAAMPLITQADCQLLLDAALAHGASVASEAENGLPRCVLRQDVEAKETALSGGALYMVRDPAELAQALAILRRRKNAGLQRAGVVLLDPERTYVDMDVAVGRGTVLHPNCTLSGGTVIGENCELFPGCRVHASQVGDGTSIENSVLLECRVGSGTTVGPFAYIRPGTAVGNHCRVGDFVELKNSAVGDGTKISHLTYVGDGDLGRNINLGCGVVFTNYDGKAKHRSAVGDNAFIGCNVNLVAPVEVGEGAYVAAGTTVTENVPKDALAIGRARQSVKEGWADRRRREGRL